MARHLLDSSRDQLRVPVLIRRYQLGHPGRLPANTLRLAQPVARTDTHSIPAIVLTASTRQAVAR